MCVLNLQVTEFTCGGFVVGLISVHTIADGLGAGQFINAVADYARGLANRGCRRCGRATPSGPAQDAGTAIAAA